MLHMDWVWSKKMFRDRTEAMLEQVQVQVQNLELY